MNCDYNIKDSIYYLNMLNRKQETGVYTIAAYETVDPENYDFATLMEALEWAKQVGSAVHATNTMTFELAEGNHTLTQSDILKQGVSNLAYNNAIAFFTNLSIIMNGAGSALTTINVDAPLGVENVVLYNADIGLTNVRMKILGTNQNEIVTVAGTRAGFVVQACQLDDVGVLAHSQSLFILGGAVSMINNNNTNKNAIRASYDSFVDVYGVDFNDSDFNVTATINSKIRFIGGQNTGSLNVSPAINTKANDQSVIYDETMPV